MKAVVIILILSTILCGHHKLKNKTDSSNDQKNKTSLLSKSDIKSLFDLASSTFTKNTLPSSFIIVGNFLPVKSELIISIDGDENRAIVKLKTTTDSVYLVLDLSEVKL